MTHKKNKSKSEILQQRAKPPHRIDARMETSREIAPNMGEGVDAPSIREFGATGRGKSKKVRNSEPTS